VPEGKKNDKAPSRKGRGRSQLTEGMTVTPSGKTTRLDSGGKKGGGFSIEEKKGESSKGKKARIKRGLQNPYRSAKKRRVRPPSAQWFLRKKRNDAGNYGEPPEQGAATVKGNGRRRRDSRSYGDV